MTAMWANFAKTGEPIPQDDELFKGVTWEPFEVENQKYLDIGKELEMNTRLNAERMSFWDKLFPIPPLPPAKK